MKGTAKPFYFSAYPLKAIKESSSTGKEPGSPYLKSLLSGITKTSSRVRVFPMIHPFSKQQHQVPFTDGKLPKDIELTEKDWFNNYE
jgi:hypothetical protein